MEQNTSDPSKWDGSSQIYIAFVEREDIRALSQIFLASFTSDFDRRIFPNTPSVKAWWDATNLEAFLHDPTVRFVKAVDPSGHGNDGRIVAYAKWVVPLLKTNDIDAKDEIDDRWPQWPADSDGALCDVFFARMAQSRESLMGDRPHYFLEMIGTLPEYQGRGAGRKLVGWGCDLADKDGLEVYLDSTAWARRLYEKHGFEVKESVEIPGGNGYVETFMVRPAKCKKLA